VSNKRRQHNWHHRKPLSLGGTSKAINLSHVRVSHHLAWHVLFENKTPIEIAAIINTVWLDPDFYLVVEAR
jgi:hypothetical protein